MSKLAPRRAHPSWHEDCQHLEPRRRLPVGILICHLHSVAATTSDRSLPLESPVGRLEAVVNGCDAAEADPWAELRLGGFWANSGAGQSRRRAPQHGLGGEARLLGSVVSAFECTVVGDCVPACTLKPVGSATIRNSIKRPSRHSCPALSQPRLSFQRLAASRRTARIRLAACRLDSTGATGSQLHESVSLHRAAILDSIWKAAAPPLRVHPLGHGP